MMASDETMDFFRIINKEFTREEEIKASIKIALELTFGEAEGRLYGRGVVGWTEADNG